MFCTKCGKEIDDNSSFCINCGETVIKEDAPNGQFNGGQFNGGQFNGSNFNQQPNGQNNYNNNPYVKPDAPSAGFAWLCFFFPIVGLILYLVWKQTYPLKAHSCIKGAIIGFILSVICLIIRLASGEGMYPMYSLINLFIK
jgi:hypothetical protein